MGKATQGGFSTAQAAKGLESGLGVDTPNSVPAVGMDQQTADGSAQGQSIVSHIGQFDHTLANDLKEVIAANSFEYYSGCYGVVCSERDAQRSNIKSEGEADVEVLKSNKDLEGKAKRLSVKAREVRMAADLAGVSVKFSKVIKVLQTIGLRFNKTTPRVIDFSTCRTFSDMLTVARESESSKKGRKQLPAMTQHTFEAWIKRAKLIIDVRGYCAEGEGENEKEEDKSRKQLAALEYAIQQLGIIYAKASASIPNMRPLVDLLPVADAPTKAEAHIKAA